jgi:hypothetical protein
MHSHSFYRKVILGLTIAVADSAWIGAHAAQSQPVSPIPPAEMVPPAASPGTIGSDSQVGPLLTLPGDGRKGANALAPRPKLEYIAPVPAGSSADGSGRSERPENANQEPALRR